MHVRLDPILAIQHALVTRHQAWTAGLSDKEINGLLARQQLLPVHRGVFRDPASPLTADQRALAAVLATGTGSVVSHRHAVSVHGQRNYECLLNEVTTRGSHVVPGIVTHRAVRTPDQTVVRSIPVTTTARTIIDVATQVGAPTIAMWMQAWLASKLLTLDDLEAQIKAMRGHAGIPVVRAALTERTLVHAAADSPPEAELGLLLQRSGLPPLTLHHLVTIPPGLNFELDWSYPQWHIAFEMDGYGVHLRTLEAFEHDRFRRNELEIAGWTILNFTKRQVERKPATVVAQVRRLLESRLLLLPTAPIR